MTMTSARDFWEDNSYSLESGEEAFWAAVYKKAFYNLRSQELCTNREKQRQGIDRILYLSNGAVLHVDEKKRREDYPDVLLEYTSCLERDTPGWIEKDLTIDYLAYAFMPSKRCFLFPWHMLRRAWLKYGEHWKGEHRYVKAKTRVGNDEYHTVSVAVPTGVLLKAVSTATIIDVSKP